VNRPQEIGVADLPQPAGQGVENNPSLIS